MKILYICHRFPYPPQRGGKIRPFNMVRHLTSQGHQVSLVSLSRSSQETAAAQGIAEFCHDFYVGEVNGARQKLRMTQRLLTPTPSSMGYFFSNKVQHEVNRRMATEQYDLIFVHCSSVAQYVENVSNIPKILDFGDMDSQKWQDYSKFRRWPLNWGFLYEGTKLEAAEKRLARKFDLCTCTSKMELDTLNSYQTGVDSDWFPNGVDSQYFKPSGLDYRKNNISFIGRMDYYPNQECVIRFCHSILPMLQERFANTEFVIVGADPPRHIQKLGQLPGVTVTGSVPDVRPFVQQSHLMVAPLSIARGTQNKILEAMAMGIPVVCSQLAASGVDAVPEEHFLTATDDASYVRQISRIFSSDEERNRLAVAGRARMLSHHGWNGSMMRMDAIIDRCVSKFQQS